MRCYEQHKKQPFANICNITYQFPCLRIDVDDPLNFTLDQPCINLNRIADGHIDCLGKSDERNILKCGLYVVGWQFGCKNYDNFCYSFDLLCSKLGACPEADHNIACFHRRGFNCDGKSDVMCLNGTCLRNARCNQKHDCLNGEDEYWCFYDVDSYDQGTKRYRIERRRFLQSKATLTQYLFSPRTIHDEQTREIQLLDHIEHITKSRYAQKKVHTSVDHTTSDDMLIDKYLESFRQNPVGILKAYLPFICNRGIPIKGDDGRTYCLCSPSYYGDYCEFQADRISIVTHLDLTQYISKTTSVNSRDFSILVSCTFRFAEHIIDRYEFRVPRIVQQMKQKFYFTYPRTTKFRNLKLKQRNGTQLYSIRFEAFDLQLTKSLTFLAAWHFPIEFYFLPAFRFSKLFALIK
ncbi:unnamed protein product [Rotaria sordida]|uniref:EGF-like domain-containing protein n=1 Tax=Rotaria sordida TaxID=392033 RepID=A0A815NIQ0_9BILA|nr:unnamed protein product [Rotaria sordida]CAF4007816.1 unnamed protein product [Rotaria sordida]